MTAARLSCYIPPQTTFSSHNHRAAADWQVLLSVLRVVHALAVCFQVVDLALYLVTVLAVSVTQPFQFVDHRCPARSQSGTPLLQLPIELRRTLPVEELAHFREVIDAVAEIQDVHTVGGPRHLPHGAKSTPRHRR